MRIKGLVLLAVMIVVTVIVLAGEQFRCSGHSRTDVKSIREAPPASAENK